MSQPKRCLHARCGRPRTDRSIDKHDLGLCDFHANQANKILAQPPKNQPFKKGAN